MKKFTSIMAIILSMVMALSLTVQAADGAGKQAAKNPGLGVRGLHKQGYTGKGVSVAFIGLGIKDGNIDSFTHPEFRDGMIKEYVDFGWGSENTYSELYKTLSPLTGKTVGTAPNVNVYLLGTNGFKDGNVVKGIEWVIKKNESLAKADKIRIINVTTFGDWEDGSSSRSYYKAVEKAEKAGIVVIAGRYSGWEDNAKLTVYAESGYYDLTAPDDVSKAKIGVPGNNDWWKNKVIIHAPSAGRTTAWKNKDGSNAYKFFSGENYNDEGIAQSYVAGVLAMGFQANPNLTNTQIVKLLRDTQTNDIINPPKFIEAAKKVK